MNPRRRYINLLKRALLNETGLDGEAAYYAAREALDRGTPFDPALTHDIRSRAPKIVRDMTPDVHLELAVSRARAASNFATFDLLDDQVHFVEGYFNESLPGAPIETIDWTGVRWRKAAAQAVS